MAHIRADVHKAVLENDIDSVVFQDPLQDEARKAKRNLVAASFGALLIASLDLQVSGFLGLQTATGTILGASITRGLACILVIYFLAGFTFSVYVDYSAWKFRRERLLIKPYLDLVSMVEGHFSVLGEQIQNAIGRLEHLQFEKEMQSQIELTKTIQESFGQLRSIAESSRSLNGEFSPLLKHWAQTIEKTRRLTWRLRARFASLWILDIAVPLALAGFAIWKTYGSVCTVAEKLTGRGHR